MELTIQIAGKCDFGFLDVHQCIGDSKESNEYRFLMGGSRGGGSGGQNPPPSAARGNIFYKWPYAFPMILNE